VAAAALGLWMVAQGCGTGAPITPVAEGTGSTAGGSCAVEAGSYTVRSVLQMGQSSLNCPSIADHTMTVAPSESFSDIMAGTMTNVTGAGVCTSSAESGCSATVSCSDTSGGLLQLYATFEFDPIRGGEKENITLSDAGLSLTCTYALVAIPN
jgi:hypothetical protein